MPSIRPERDYMIARAHVDKTIKTVSKDNTEINLRILARDACAGTTCPPARIMKYVHEFYVLSNEYVVEDDTYLRRRE